MRENRKYKRMQVVSYLKVSHKNDTRFVGNVIDLTTRGLRMRGEHPVIPQTTYHFKLTLPKPKRGIKELIFDAEVVWCREEINPRMYESGLRINKIAPSNIGILEDFMTEASEEDRYLTIAENLPQEY